MRRLAAVITLLLLGLAMSVDVRASESGVASWYDDGPGFYAAVHSFRWGDPPYRVVVTADNGNSIVVTVRDFCQCYVDTERERVIDLSPAAFAALAPLSNGLVRVTVFRAGLRPAGPGATPPPTDVEPMVAARRGLRLPL